MPASKPSSGQGLSGAASAGASLEGSASGGVVWCEGISKNGTRCGYSSNFVKGYMGRAARPLREGSRFCLHHKNQQSKQGKEQQQQPKGAAVPLTSTSGSKPAAATATSTSPYFSSSDATAGAAAAAGAATSTSKRTRGASASAVTEGAAAADDDEGEDEEVEEHKPLKKTKKSKKGESESASAGAPAGVHKSGAASVAVSAAAAAMTPLPQKPRKGAPPPELDKKTAAKVERFNRKNKMKEALIHRDVRRVSVYGRATKPCDTCKSMDHVAPGDVYFFGKKEDNTWVKYCRPCFSSARW